MTASTSRSRTPVSLLERLRENTSNADWERFVELYTPLLYTWTRRMGLTPDDAADLVQEVFTQLVRKLRDFSYDPRRRFRAWLRTVFLNKAHEVHRRRDVVATAGQLPAEGLAAPNDVAEMTEEEYRRYLVGQAARLMRVEFPESYWQAFWETTAQDRPIDEVAKELGISKDVVYQARSRVLQRLRQELKGLLD